MLTEVQQQYLYFIEIEYFIWISLIPGIVLFLLTYILSKWYCRPLKNMRSDFEPKTIDLLGQNYWECKWFCIFAGNISIAAFMMINPGSELTVQDEMNRQFNCCLSCFQLGAFSMILILHFGPRTISIQNAYLVRWRADLHIANTTFWLLIAPVCMIAYFAWDFADRQSISSVFGIGCQENSLFGGITLSAASFK